MTDEDSQVLARVGVRRASVSISTEGHAPTSKILSVTRITVPTFEVLYRDARGALADARGLRRDRAFELGREIDAEAGGEVVLELAVSEFAFSVTLLFRVVGRKPGFTVLEWWARRQTDETLLGLWIEALEATIAAPAPSRPSQTDSTQAGSGPGDSSIPATPTLPGRAELLHEIMETYRRVLSGNPFDVLGIHWTSNGRLAAEAATSIVNELEQKAALARGDDQVLRYLNQTAQRVQRAAAALGELEHRKAIRHKMVAPKELANARKQAEYLLQLALREGRVDQIERAQAMLSELA